MTISELKRTLVFVSQKIIDANVPRLFDGLIAVLRANAAVQPHTGQQQQPITSQKAALIAGVDATSPESLSLNERVLLSSLIDMQLLGESGVKRINGIFAEHNLDPMGAIAAFQDMKSKVDKLVTTTQEALKVLAPIDAKTTDLDIEPGHAVLQITFKEKATIGNLTDWREYAGEWWSIVRAYGLLTGTTADQAKIISFQQGSIIVEIGVLYAVARTIGYTVDKILAAIERIMELRKKIHEIKNLELTNKQIVLDLEKEAKSFQENAVSHISKQVIQHEQLPKAADGETENAIKMAVEKLFEFLDKGGTVDLRLGVGHEVSPESKQLKEVYTKVRTLETRVQEMKLISDGGKEQK